jgi:lycopene beta-cyclase
MTRVIIAGGGLAGCLAARALANRTDLKILLVEQGPAFGGNHTWSFFDSDIAPEHRWIVDGMVGHRWDDHEVHFPSRSRTISTGYNSIRSPALDSEIRGALRPDQYRLGATIVEVSPTQVFLAGGERLDADAVIDARGSGSLEGLDLGWQKFVGRTYECAAGHHIAPPVIMDATVDQIDGYRFAYRLPISATELLIEDTYYSPTPILDREILRGRVESLAIRTEGGSPSLLEEESGVLPVVLGGSVDSFWQAASVNTHIISNALIYL